MLQLEMSGGVVRAPVPLPAPRVAIAVRAGVVADLPFMDRLQRMHSKAVGFMPLGQLEGHVRAGKVLVAEQVQSDECRVQSEEGAASSSSSFSTQHSAVCNSPIGYCLASDRYFKHDDVGIVYQMNVEPGRQRALVGAALLKAQFERSAYGCKLYCCWCAQDLAANKFWEAMGFVPLAFRTGSERKSRVHIFWQKRIRAGDTTTPWWFPSETTGGAVRGNRVVLPMPPGTHWSDAKPLVLPGVAAEAPAVPRERKVRAAKVVAKPAVASISMGGLRFGPAVVPAAAVAAAEKPKRAKVRNDPLLVAAARELRDRWLEQVNGGPVALPCGKYDVSRLPGPAGAAEAGRLLAA